MLDHFLNVYARRLQSFHLGRFLVVPTVEAGTAVGPAAGTEGEPLLTTFVMPSTGS